MKDENGNPVLQTIEKNDLREDVQDTKFKLYDSNKNTYHAPGFYNMQYDIKEKTPLPYSSLKSAQRITEQTFAHALDSINRK